MDFDEILAEIIERLADSNARATELKELIEKELDNKDIEEVFIQFYIRHELMMDSLIGSVISLRAAVAKLVENAEKKDNPFSSN